MPMRQRLVSFAFGAKAQKVSYEEYDADGWTLPRICPLVDPPANSLRQEILGWKPVILKILGVQDCWDEAHLRVGAIALKRRHDEVTHVTLHAAYTVDLGSGLITTPLKLELKDHLFDQDQFPVAIRRAIARLELEVLRYLHGWNERSLDVTPPEVDISKEALQDLEGEAD